MLRANPQIRQEAMAALKGKWTNPVIASAVYLIALTVIGFIPGLNSISTIATIPLAFGLSVWFLRFKRTGQDQEIGTLFVGFSDFKRVFVTLFLMQIYTMLWSMLLVVPGVIKGLSYSMTTYILQDEPELSNNAAIEKSMAMMEGHKMQLFLMSLNFMMWTIISCGIGMFIVIPYMQTTMAAFYEEVKSDYASRQ